VENIGMSAFGLIGTDEKTDSRSRVSLGLLLRELQRPG